MVESKDKAAAVEADNKASNHNRDKIKIAHRDQATNKIVLRNLQVQAEPRPNKVEGNRTVDKTQVVTSATIIQTGRAVVINRGKIVTAQTEEVVSSKDKIKTPAITAGIKNNEVLKGTSGFYTRRFLILRYKNLHVNNSK